MMASSADNHTLDASTCRVYKKLGTGGFAEVYAARLLEGCGDNEKVALKLLRPLQQPHNPCPDDVSERLFLSEAQLCGELCHRNVLRGFGLYRVPSNFLGIGLWTRPTWGMLLEYCESGSLKDCVLRSMSQGRRSYSDGQALQWLVDVACGLHFLHTRQPGIIHRDVKADNVLLKWEKDGETGRSHTVAKLGDLGLHVRLGENRSVMLRRRGVDPKGTDPAFLTISSTASEPLYRTRALASPSSEATSPLVSPPASSCCTFEVASAAAPAVTVPAAGTKHVSASVRPPQHRDGGALYGEGDGEHELEDEDVEEEEEEEEDGSSRLVSLENVGAVLLSSECSAGGRADGGPGVKIPGLVDSGHGSDPRALMQRQQVTATTTTSITTTTSTTTTITTWSMSRSRSRPWLALGGIGSGGRPPSRYQITRACSPACAAEAEASCSRAAAAGDVPDSRPGVPYAADVRGTASSAAARGAVSSCAPLTCEQLAGGQTTGGDGAAATLAVPAGLTLPPAAATVAGAGGCPPPEVQPALAQPSSRRLVMPPTPTLSDYARAAPMASNSKMAADVSAEHYESLLLDTEGTVSQPPTTGRVLATCPTLIGGPDASRATERSLSRVPASRGCGEGANPSGQVPAELEKGSQLGSASPAAAVRSVHLRSAEPCTSFAMLPAGVNGICAPLPAMAAETRAGVPERSVAESSAHGASLLLASGLIHLVDASGTSAAGCGDKPPAQAAADDAPPNIGLSVSCQHNNNNSNNSSSSSSSNNDKTKTLRLSRLSAVQTGRPQHGELAQEQRPAAAAADPQAGGTETGRAVGTAAGLGQRCGEPLVPLTGVSRVLRMAAGEPILHLELVPPPQSADSPGPKGAAARGAHRAHEQARRPGLGKSNSAPLRQLHKATEPALTGRPQGPPPGWPRPTTSNQGPGGRPGGLPPGLLAPQAANGAGPLSPGTAPNPGSIAIGVLSEGCVLSLASTVCSMDGGDGDGGAPPEGPSAPSRQQLPASTNCTGLGGIADTRQPSSDRVACASRQQAGTARERSRVMSSPVLGSLSLARKAAARVCNRASASRPQGHLPQSAGAGSGAPQPDVAASRQRLPRPKTSGFLRGPVSSAAEPSLEGPPAKPAPFPPNPQSSPARNSRGVANAFRGPGDAPRSVPLPPPLPAVSRLRVQVSAESFKRHMRRLSSITELLHRPHGAALPDLEQYNWVYGLTARAGSCMYMAPEVFLKQPYNEKCDVFSFGVLLYELLNHELLLCTYGIHTRALEPGVRTPADWARAVSCGFRPPRPRRFSDAQWSLVSRCWHQDPCERPDMGQVLRELQAMQDEQEKAQRQRQPQMQPQQRKKHGEGWRMRSFGRFLTDSRSLRSSTTPDEDCKSAPVPPVAMTLPPAAQTGRPASSSGKAGTIATSTAASAAASASSPGGVCGEQHRRSLLGRKKECGTGKGNPQGASDGRHTGVGISGPRAWEREQDLSPAAGSAPAHCGCVIS